MARFSKTEDCLRQTRGTDAMLYTEDGSREAYRIPLSRARQARAEAVARILAFVFRSAVGAGRTLAAHVRKARRRHAAIRELHALDDHLLKDIGISRGQIPYVVEQQLVGTRSEGLQRDTGPRGRSVRVRRAPSLERVA